MGDVRYTAPTESGAQALRRYARGARSGLDGIPTNSWRHIRGPQDDALFTELRTEFLHDGHPDHESPSLRAAVSGQSSERPDLSELCPQDRCGWQRYRGYPSARGPG